MSKLSRPSATLMAAAALALAAGCSGTPARPGPATDAAATPDPAAAPLLEDITAASGVDFRYQNGRSGQMYLTEIMGGGAALLDFDGDGDQDLFLVQGGALRAAADAAPTLQGPIGDRLYRNEGGAVPRFVDVTAASGIREQEYGVGAATGDFDNDGRVDLYVSNWGPNRLWRNLGDGRFEDATEMAGAQDERWSAGATFFDYDRDGWLDLFVLNYLDYGYAEHHACFNPDGTVDYCGPKAYSPARDRLLHNRGDGTFEDVTEAMGLLAADGPGLAVSAADYDGDGWQDLYVANDQAPNVLWLNRAGRRLENAAVASGLAVDGQGKAEASMGLSLADFDLDDDLDVFVTNLEGESHTYYTHQGGALYEDRGDALGPSGLTLPYTGFGTCALDLALDGLPDLAVANGAVVVDAEQKAAGVDFPLRQPNLLLQNEGQDRFRDVTAQAGAALTAPNVGRGLACGDLDEDGDADLVLTRNDGPPLILLNRAADGAAWLGLRLLDAAGRRDATGSTVSLEGRPGVHLAATDGSYASAHDPRVRIGLGRGGQVGPQTARVRWPDGAEEVFEGLEPGRYHEVRQGAGR